jgi:acetolactate synthase I/II/III large subunit
LPNIAEAIARTLAEYETKFFFCFMGGDHELWYALEDASIRLINCRSEAGAVYMADGYARISGKPGYVYGQRGPGVSNVAGSLADGWWAKSPVISLTSAIPMDVRDRFEYQELDGLPLHVGVTKWNKTVSHPDRACAMVRAAIRAATTAAPGPVHLEIPAEMLALDADETQIWAEPDARTVTSRRAPADPAAIEAIVRRLLGAEQPLIVAGKGVLISEAWEELTSFAETYRIPVVTSLGGKGSIAETSDLAGGVMGRNSRRIANDLVRDCDVVLAIGTRLGGLATHRWHLPFDQKVLMHIDPDPQILGHNYKTEIGVAADAKLALRAALPVAERAGAPGGKRAEWADAVSRRIIEWRGNAEEHSRSREKDGVHPAAAVAAVRSVLGPNDIIGADTGAHGGWVGALYPVQAGKTFVRSNGSLGWIFPGAMGAALAAPDRRVVAMTGDGGMLYHIAEFETALRCGIPVVSVVLNNACLASEYHTEKRKYQRVAHSVVDFRDVDFAGVAQAFGAWGRRVDDPAHVADAVRDALASGQPALIDVVTSKEAQSPSANFDAKRLV